MTFRIGRSMLLAHCGLVSGLDSHNSSLAVPTTAWPARRPVQVTQDLASFWANTYLEVRKDLKGRYPKHYWPDDPLIAEPTARAKPRK